MKGARKGPLLADPSTNRKSVSGASSLSLPLPKNGSAIPTRHALCLLELGIAPGISESGFDIAFPVKVGLSLDDYYELAGVDHTFGFLSLVAIATLPMFQSGQNGAWDLHGGIEFQSLGDTPEAFNGGDQSKFIGIIGVGFRTE
jgi:hypothetical protein